MVSLKNLNIELPYDSAILLPNQVRFPQFKASQNAETPRFAAEGLLARQLGEETGKHVTDAPP